MTTATTTTTSALLTWDETIVPALRKRLESESRILAKRMSVASINSTDDPLRSPGPPRPRDVPISLTEPRKSSAIPRPSLQYSRSPDPRPDPPSSYNRVNGPSFPSKRARTYSQPPSESPDAFTPNPLPTPDDSRSASPRTSDVKPTRIPMAARSRTASASSHAHFVAQRADSRNGTHHPYQPPTPDIPQASEPQPITLSLRHQHSNIMNEPPPFATSLITSSVRSKNHVPIYPDPRPSVDSEERPFEHWYRGDIHRNGGVGELRVAKHVEMLQIANYGHNLRKAVLRDLSTQTDSARSRKRADSFGIATRESLHLEDDPTTEVGMVLDENPLTDIEGDPDTDPETFYDAYAGVDADDTFHSASTSSPLPAAVSIDRSQTPTTVVPQHGDITPKRPSQSPSDPSRSSISSAIPRASAESSRPAPRYFAPRSRSMSSSTAPSSDQSHTKRRAKSPAASSPVSTPKKPKTRANMKSPAPSTSRDPRISVATYPTPEGDMLNAIPTWTQPVQKSGNWDEVVLPVVARKKGLDDLYERADGSPKPRSSESTRIQPAPGTFGYDYNKYRPPRRDEEIPMDEFGRSPAHTPPPEEDQEEQIPPRPETPPRPISQPVRREPPPIRLDPRKTIPNPPESPVPFAQYRVDQQVLPTVPTINVTRPSSEFDRRRQEGEDDDFGGGCCKCIVM